MSPDPVVTPGSRVALRGQCWCGIREDTPVFLRNIPIWKMVSVLPTLIPQRQFINSSSNHKPVHQSHHQGRMPRPVPRAASTPVNSPSPLSKFPASEAPREERPLVKPRVRELNHQGPQIVSSAGARLACSLEPRRDTGHRLVPGLLLQLPAGLTEHKGPGGRGCAASPASGSSSGSYSVVLVQC